MDSMIIQEFPTDKFVPPVGQGCVAIEAAGTLADDKREAIRACLNNPESESCLLAERAFLRCLEGGCSIPAFALATLDGNTLSLSGGLVSLDGKQQLTSKRNGSRSEAESIGKELGTFILNSGGKELLAAIRAEQK
jgi:hydroxymethylbilane synthase